MAIAFYDSGRLLPYRHKHLSEQIQQRNQDAERTRQYIGYAGGAFANMAERTGSIFGADLYSGYKGHPDTARKAGGQEVSFKEEKQPKEYFGGTIGRDAAKAGWQKGVTDQENRRRETTHRLGLLMKNVEYGNFQRDWEAWGGRDKEALRKNYTTRWDQYIKDSQLGEDKLLLMSRYSDMYDQDTQDKLKVWHSGKLDELITDGTIDEDYKQAYREKLEASMMTNNTFEKYAENNGLYNKSVAARPREDVNMLLAYLKDGVRYPGMNQVMDKFSRDKENRVSIQKEEEKTDPKAGKQRWLQIVDGIVKKASSSKDKDEGGGGQRDDSTNLLFEPERFKSDTGKEIFKITDKVNPTEEKDLTEAMIIARRKNGIWDVKPKDFNADGSKLEGLPRFLEFSGRVLDTAREIWRGGGTWHALWGSYEPNREKHGLLNKIVFDLMDGEFTDENKKKAEEWADGLIEKLRGEQEVISARYAEKQGFELGPRGPRITGGEFYPDLSAPAATLKGRLNQVYQNLMAHEDKNSRGLVIDDNKHAILAGSVDAWELVNRDKKLMRSVMKDQLGLTEGSNTWNDFEDYFMSANPNDHLGHVTKDGVGTINSGQRQNRQGLRLNSNQTRNLVMWAYNKNKSALDSYNNDIPLNRELYNQYPALEQLLGDLAYRHGGDFMTKKGGYVKFKKALKNTLNTNSRSNAEASLDAMGIELFDSATYKDKITDRVKFLKDRLRRFREKILTPFNFKFNLGMGSQRATGPYFDVNEFSFDAQEPNRNTQINDMSTISN